MFSLMENPISPLLLDVPDEEIAALIDAAARIWLTPVDMSVKLVSAHATEVLHNLACTLSPTEKHYELIQRWMNYSM
jgi:hypothetical protein